MKILMATMGLDIGGAETHIVELSKALKALGHEVAVVSNGGVYVPEIQAAGIRHYSAPLDQRSLTAMFRARRVLKQILRRERPDIVHAHARIPAFLCGTLGGRERYAFVTSCHGVYQVSGMLKLLSNWGEHALAVSEDIRDYLMEQYGVPEEQIALTINGIDTERFSPAVSGEVVRAELGLGEGPVVGHVSRLDRAASHTARQLIAIAPRLCAQVPGLQIVIAGGGDVYEELAALARQANERIGRAGVVLTGPRTDVDRILAACCLFVGVSRAALEAMAAGKPAVLSGAQGHTGLFTPELLDKAVDTNFCCRTDPVSTQDQLLEDILAALALPPERRAELGAFGRQVVQERYSVSRMARDALSVYDRVRRRRYRVVMSGYYGFGNAGDDAILESIHQSIRSASDEVAVTVLSNDPELTRKQYGLDAVPRFRALRVFRALWKGDALLSGGGSLLQDATSTRSLVYYLSVIHCARLLHKPVMLYANGILSVPRPTAAGCAGRWSGPPWSPSGTTPPPRSWPRWGWSAPSGSQPTRCSAWSPPEPRGPRPCAPPPACPRGGLSQRCPSGTGTTWGTSSPSWRGCATTCAGPTVWRSSSSSCSQPGTGRPPIRSGRGWRSPPMCWRSPASPGS